MINSNTINNSHTNNKNNKKNYISNIYLIIKTKQQNIIKTLSTHKLQNTFINYLYIYKSSFNKSIISKISKL